MPILSEMLTHLGITARLHSSGYYLKLNNDFASDRCTVAELEESVSP